MKWKTLGITVTVLALLGGGGFAGWRAWQASNEKTLDERYQFEDAARGEIVQNVTANGTLNPVVLVSVGTQVSGTVKKLHADFNAKVEAGQMLLELEPTLFRAAVEQSSGNVANATASLKLAQANEARIRRLVEQDYVPRHDSAALVTRSVEAANDSRCVRTVWYDCQTSRLTSLRSRSRVAACTSTCSRAARMRYVGW